MDVLRDPIWQFLGVAAAVILFMLPISYQYLKRRTTKAPLATKTIRPTIIPIAQELTNSKLGQYQILATVSETSLSSVWRVKKP